jgi:hypothetical protein
LLEKHIVNRKINFLLVRNFVDHTSFFSPFSPFSPFSHFFPIFPPPLSPLSPSSFLLTVMTKSNPMPLTEQTLQQFVEAQRDQMCYVKLVSGTSVRLTFQEIASRVQQQLLRAKMANTVKTDQAATDIAICWIFETCADVIVSLDQMVDRKKSRVWFVLQVMIPSHVQADGKFFRMVVPNTTMVSTLILSITSPFGGDVNKRSFFYYWTKKNTHALTKHAKAMAEHTIKWLAR